MKILIEFGSLSVSLTIIPNNDIERTAFKQLIELHDSGAVIKLLKAND